MVYVKVFCSLVSPYDRVNKISTKPLLARINSKMESVPLIPKAEVLPNSDVSPLIRELFQQEFQYAVPSKKLSENIVKSLQYEKASVTGEKESFKSVEFLENLTKRKDNLIDFAEAVFEAYTRHEKNLKAISDAEENIFEVQACYLKRESTILEHSEIHDLLKLKRQPLLKALDDNYVKEFRLLQGDAGLPPKFEAKSDFRVSNFMKWRRRLESVSQDSLIMGLLKMAPLPLCDESFTRPLHLKKEVSFVKPKRIPRLKQKKSKVNVGTTEIFRAEPKFVFFTDYKPGEVYYAEIELKNVYSKGIRFQLKPMSPEGPFRVKFYESNAKVFPGLSIFLTIEFAPKSLDNVTEDVNIVIEDGTKLSVPLMAYLEPPILKTHLDLDECTKNNSERIASSYIECGSCFAGDTKVTKLRFHGCRGSGEFFIMSSENWDRSNVNSVTVDNLLEIPPFRVYPVYFKMEKNEVIDLFVEFSPKTFGTHVENIVIACDNGEVRRLDLIADSVGWHSYFFSFQDFLLKELPVDKDDDLKVKYYLSFNESKPSGKVEKTFCIYNNSHMSFEFQWKIRDANMSTGQDKYLKLSKQQVKIDPESGTFKPKSVWEFLVTLTFDNAEIGEYRAVLSFYVLNLPYQCIEEDNTIIQPTGLVRNLYSQSLYGEEEYLAPSPELLSLQGTYESLQESIKSYVECQNKAQALSKFDFCRTTCIPNPNLCAKPLKKSKTYLNIGDDEGWSCICRGRPPESDSTPESCTWNGEKINEASILKNEVTWDFVDILVDEIELWAEVSPTKVTLQPSVVEFFTPLKINDPPTFKKVKIINHNRFPVTCQWTKPSRSFKSGQNYKGEKPSVSLLFNHQARSDSSENSKEYEKDLTCREKCGSSKTGEKILQITIPEEISDGNCEDLELCNIFVEPGDEFTVPRLSDFICNVGLSPCQPGKISEVLTLSVNGGDLNLTLKIMGTGVTNYFSTSPEILDFGALRQGTRHMEEYKIINESPNSLFWRINQFDFDFENEQFFNSVEIGEKGSVKRYKGILTGKDNMAVEPFYMDARKPGIKCSLLEVQLVNSRPEVRNNRYIMILGNVKLPALSLQATRFENGILAPAGMMYVGQTISTQVTLRNIGNVETSFIWGHPFGCHCRKIKVEILPKKGKIDKMETLTLNVSLTPLEEGIINHCYIPCFFCRTVHPLILSIVGITENLNVTFEIIDYPDQKHADVSNFIKSPFYHTVLRVAWPFKNYDSNVGRKYLHEEDILNMQCHCLEVEEEGNRAFDGQPLPESEPAFSEENLLYSESTSKNSKSLSSKISRIPEKESKRSNSSETSNGDRKISEVISPVYPSRGSSIEALQFVKFELEFLNVPFQTPIQRQFVIRNETPVETTFQLKVFTFGVSEENREKRIEAIRNRVFEYSNDDYKNKMTKEQPLVLVVEPTKGELLGYDTACINVFAYGNTWGEYRDYIICEVKGIQAFYLKVFIQIAGHPIEFPMFNDQALYKPTLRFEPTTYISEPTMKRIRVRNRSAIPLTMCWIIFLTTPLEKDEEQEDSFNLGIDSNVNLDSNHSEESSKSAKVYLPKNTSGSILTFRNKLEMLDYSQNSGTFESFGKSESISGKNGNQDREGERSNQSFNIPSLVEEDKSDIQQLPSLGKIDHHIFQIDPKEVTFDAFEEKRLTITFDPRVHKPKTLSQEFKAVLTGWVKLRTEDEKLPGVYYRPCGINFVSEMLDLNAITETSLVSFEMLKGDLKFIVDANEVVKSPLKKLQLSRKFLIKNNSRKSVWLKIEITPEVVFRIKRINTIDKVYEKYNPDKHRVKVDPGKLFEIELECSVSYKDVSYAFEKLLLDRKKEENTSDEMKTSSKSKSETENDEDQFEKVQKRNIQGKEPCTQYLNAFTPVNKENSNLEVKDSFPINVNRMSFKSGSSCSDSSGKNRFPEVEGECFDLPFLEEIPEKPKPVQNIYITEEEINFVQTELITQTFGVQLHLSFPVIKISPKRVDFGNVYIGEPAVRYCSFINLRGFPTDYIIKQRCKVSDFVVKPVTGSLSPTNYKSDTGKIITIEFKPSQPGYCKEIFLVYCNSDLEFDCFELFVTGIGTWNEKYRFPKLETCPKLGVYHTQ